MEERLQGNPVSEGIAYAKSYIYIPGTLTKAPEFFPKGQEEEKYREFRESCEKADSELVTLELLSRETLYKAAALEQVTHLTDAVQNLKAA